MWIGIHFIASLYNCALHIQYIPAWHLTYLYGNILIEQSPETTLVYEAIILSHIASLEAQKTVVDLVVHDVNQTFIH